MRVVVLASGSKGNATYVEEDGVRLLIDAGISALRTKKALAALDVDVASLDGIFLTHEHSDHIGGLVTLEKRYHFPVFSRRATLASLSCIDKLPAECFHPLEDYGNTVSWGNVLVQAFSVSHDAADPVGYSVAGSERCTIATDLGFVSQSVQAALEGADVLVLEANHDPSTLRQGRYPWPLKRRILSNRGHLANEDAAWAIARLRKQPRKVLLAHLSEENNTPELARETVTRITERQGLHVLVQTASQTTPVATRM